MPPAKWFHQHFNPGKEPAPVMLALKPWGFTYQVEDLVKTLEVEAAGGHRSTTRIGVQRFIRPSLRNVPRERWTCVSNSKFAREITEED